MDTVIVGNHQCAGTDSGFIRNTRRVVNCMEFQCTPKTSPQDPSPPERPICDNQDTKSSFGVLRSCKARPVHSSPPSHHPRSRYAYYRNLCEPLGHPHPPLVRWDTLPSRLSRSTATLGACAPLGSLGHHLRPRCAYYRNLCGLPGHPHPPVVRWDTPPSPSTADCSISTTPAGIPPEVWNIERVGPHHPRAAIAVVHLPVSDISLLLLPLVKPVHLQLALLAAFLLFGELAVVDALGCVLSHTPAERDLSRFGLLHATIDTFLRNRGSWCCLCDRSSGLDRRWLLGSGPEGKDRGESRTRKRERPS